MEKRQIALDALAKQTIGRLCSLGGGGPRSPHADFSRPRARAQGLRVWAAAQIPQLRGLEGHLIVPGPDVVVVSNIEETPRLR